MSKPFCRARSITCVAASGAGSLVLRSFTNSSACISPMPRTSPMSECLACNSSNLPRKYFPTTSAFSSKFSSSINSIVALAATLVTGLPPNVAMFAPWKLPAISGVVTVRPTGAPLAIPFALVIMSGITSQFSMPNHFLPVRPQPVCTSSAMNRAPYFFTILKTILKYSFGDERGDVAAGPGLNEILHVVGARYFAIGIFQVKGAAIAVGIDGMGNPHADDTGFAIRRMRGDGFGERRAARIGVAQRDDVKAASGHSRQQNSGFVGFRAGAGE